MSNPYVEEDIRLFTLNDLKRRSVSQFKYLGQDFMEQADDDGQIVRDALSWIYNDMKLLYFRVRETLRPRKINFYGSRMTSTTLLAA
ncbi:hypothetical protein ACHAQH_009760 [Verticillium albo-atrum]